MPDDIARYYPPNYYSMNLTDHPTKKEPGLVRFIKSRRLNSYLGNSDPIGQIVSRIVGPAWFSEMEKDHVPLRAGYRILDMGCGDGYRLHRWSRHGFSHLHGLDPFIEEDVTFPNGVRLFKSTLDNFEGSYDFIIAYHSLEHMWPQQVMMDSLYRLLKPNRFAQIGIPLASSAAWETYREDWYGLDAPRHFYLHTFESFELIAQRAGFRIESIVHDSNAVEIWASKQYQMDIPFNDERSYQLDRPGSIFTPEQISAFEREVEELNRSGRSHQARFFLYKEG